MAGGITVEERRLGVVDPRVEPKRFAILPLRSSLDHPGSLVYLGADEYADCIRPKDSRWD